MSVNLSFSQQEIFDREMYYPNTSVNTVCCGIIFQKNVTYENDDKESITAQIKRVKSSGDQFYLSRTRTYKKKAGEKCKDDLSKGKYIN